MLQNVGNVDKIIRVIIGIVLLSLIFFLSGSIRWIGLIGLIPLLTGLIGNCPLYSIFGLSTCPLKRK